jgi:hypothetical protein
LTASVTFTIAVWWSLHRVVEPSEFNHWTLRRASARIAR